mmetsp:Transcript_35106/g.92031  ORF Transcript_35106/g.92031 Transcript_35106/m.92031 type:complete len:360 (+) Transcript_35106:1209-2288(+)
MRVAQDRRPPDSGRNAAEGAEREGREHVGVALGEESRHRDLVDERQRERREQRQVGVEHAVHAEDADQVAQQLEPRVGDDDARERAEERAVEDEAGAGLEDEAGAARTEGKCEHHVQPEQEEGMDAPERPDRVEPRTPLHVALDGLHRRDLGLGLAAAEAVARLAEDLQHGGGRGREAVALVGRVVHVVEAAGLPEELVEVVVVALFRVVDALATRALPVHLLAHRAVERRDDAREEPALRPRRRLRGRRPQLEPHRVEDEAEALWHVAQVARLAPDERIEDNVGRLREEAADDLAVGEGLEHVGALQRERRERGVRRRLPRGVNVVGRGGAVLRHDDELDDGLPRGDARDELHAVLGL